MPLFEVAIVKRPTPAEIEKGIPEKLILGPVPVISRDKEAAATVALMENPVPLPNDPSMWEVLVRPFVQ